MTRNQKLFSLLNFPPCSDEDRAQYDDNAVREVVRGDPETVKTKFQFDWATIYPLQQAIALGASAHTVEVMYDAFPDALSSTDDGPGWTPLHVACRCEAGIEVVHILVEKYPAAMEVRDMAGLTPLHLACMYHAPWDVVRLLVMSYPMPIEMRFSDNKTPLHFVCLHGAPLVELRLFLEHYPTALIMQDDSMSTPLHLASQSNAPLESLKLIVAHYSMAITMRDCDGCTPLHIACSDEPQLEVVGFLSERYPLALEQLDNEGNTPLQLALQNNAPCDVLTLLRTLHTLLCLNPKDSEVQAMLLKCRGTEWQSCILPIIKSRPALLQKLEIQVELMPNLLQKVGCEGTFPIMFGVVRESMSLFEVQNEKMGCYEAIQARSIN